MTLAVTDVRATAEHQIAEAAKALGQSSQRHAIFRVLHSGKKRVKTVQEIADATALPRKRVLEEAVKLVHKQIINKTKRDGDTAYERDNFYYVHRDEILRRSGQRRTRAKVAPSSRPPTKARSRKHRPSTPARRSDIFLSHASEDKTAIARPLYTALRKAGVSVWFDEAELTLGDSLRRKIDEGLAHSRFGVVILSPNFFAKDWPQKELDGLVARENASGQKAILPIWHNLTKAQVARYSPTLADRLAGSSKEGTASLVRKIQAALKAPSGRSRRR